MDLSRRTFLQAAGATASVVAATGAGGAATAMDARNAGLAAGNGPYLVTWDKGMLEQCANYHDAVHRASVLRHGYGIQTQHIRCTHGLLAQLQANPTSAWIEVDGLALTEGEAKRYGFDLLRKARDPEHTRKQLWQHHLQDLRDTVEREQLTDDATAYYSLVSGEPEQIAEEREQLTRIDDGVEREVHACTPGLAEDLRKVIDGCGECPAIDTTFQQHMTREEFDACSRADIRFQLAATQPVEEKIVFVGSGEPRQCHARGEDGWLFAARGVHITSRCGDDHGTDQDPIPLRGSQHLAMVLEANGFAPPGFWRSVNGVTHHLDEFEDNVPAPEVAGRKIRHQNRHT